MTKVIIHHTIYLYPSGTKEYAKTIWLADNLSMHSFDRESLINWSIVKICLDDLQQKHGFPKVTLLDSGYIQFNWKTRMLLEEIDHD